MSESENVGASSEAPQAQQPQAEAPKTEASPAKAPKRRRLKKWLMIGVPIVLVLYTLGGFVGVPVVIQKLVIPKVGELLNGTITLDKARCNPYTLTLTLEGLSINDEQGKRLLGFDRFFGDLQASSIYSDGFVFKTLEVDRPFAEATLLDDGTINLASLMKPSDEPPSTEPIELPHVRVGTIAITQGHLGFFDEGGLAAEPFEFVIDPLSFGIENLDTRPENKNPHQFEATTDLDETLTWEGTFFLNPLTSAGRFTLEGIDLSRYKPYLGRFTKLQLASGKLGLDVSYDLAPVGDPPVAKVSLASLTVDDVKVMQDETTIVEGVDVAVEGVEVDAVSRTVVAQRVATSDGNLLVQRGEDGQLTVMSALLVEAEATPDAETAEGTADTPADTPATPSDPAPATATAGGVPASPWQPVVDGINKIILNLSQGWEIELVQAQVLNYTLRATDASTPTLAELGVQEVNLTVGPTRSSEGYVVPFDIALRQLSPAEGSIAVTGTAGVEALTVAVDTIDIQGLDLSVAAPYVGMFVPDASLESGKVSVTGKAAADVSDEASPKATFAGDVKLQDLLINGPIQGEPMLAYESLDIKGIDFDHAAATVSVQEIDGVGLKASAAVPIVAEEAEGQDAAEAQADAAPEAADESAGEYQPLKVELPYAVSVAKHTQTGGHLFVLGTGVEPEVRFAVDDIKLDYSGFTTDADAERGQISVGAKPGGSGQFLLTGSFKPHFDDLNKSEADLEIKLDALPLMGFSGISGKYVGKEIESGDFYLDPFTFTMSDYAFKTSPKFKIEMFNFGKKVDSPDAIKLPIDLAVAILKGPSGTIAPPQIPISGPLDDPSVSVGGVVLHALGNLITGVVAAPFNMLAGALQGSGVNPDDLSHVAFADGSAALTDESRKRMDLLAKGMAQRPGLAVVLEARPLPERDEDALIREAFVDLARQATLPTLPEDHPAAKDPSVIQLSETQYRLAVKSAYLSMKDPEAQTPGEMIVEPVILEDGSNAQRVERRPTVAGRGARSAAGAGRSSDAPADPEAAQGPVEMPDGSTVPFEQAEAEVLATITLPDDAVEQLQQRRLAAARDYLVQSTPLTEDRVELSAEDAVQDTEPAEASDAKLPDAPVVKFAVDVASGG